MHRKVKEIFFLLERERERETSDGCSSIQLTFMSYERKREISDGCSSIRLVGARGLSRGNREVVHSTPWFHIVSPRKLGWKRRDMIVWAFNTMPSSWLISQFTFIGYGTKREHGGDFPLYRFLLIARHGFIGILFVRPLHYPRQTPMPMHCFINGATSYFIDFTFIYKHENPTK